MYTTTHTFEKVVYKVSKRGICPACGKSATRSSGELFMQTINPFNKNAEGRPKSYREIMSELQEKARPWKAAPVYHAQCEG